MLCKDIVSTSNITVCLKIAHSPTLLWLHEHIKIYMGYVRDCLTIHIVLKARI